MKPGKGSGVYRLKCKHLLQGNVIDKTYRSGDKVPAADVEDFPLQYMYNDSREWHFMHPETYEQYGISKETLGDVWKYLKEEMKCDVTFWNGQPITVTPPNHVVLEITYCEPGAKGNTATNVKKPATVETDARPSVLRVVTSSTRAICIRTILTATFGRGPSRSLPVGRKRRPARLLTAVVDVWHGS